MSSLIIGIILLISYILETSILSGIDFFGAAPALVLVVIICYGIINGKEKGAVLGLITGIIVDILGSGVFGVNTLLYTYSATVAGLLSNKIFGKNALTAIVITFIVSFLYGIVFSIAMYITKYDRNLVYLIFGHFLPMCVYNAFISFFIYLIIENLSINSYRRSRG